MLASALRLFVYGFIGCGVASYAAVKYRGVMTPMDIANTMAVVSFVLAGIAMPLLGSSRFARGHALESDPRKAGDGPAVLDNRARGAALLAAAVCWLCTAIAWYSLFTK